MRAATGEAFPRSARLVKAEDFKQVFQHNRRIADDCLTLLVARSPGTQSRIGFAIARKQIRRAVDRNRIKRLLRESFRRRRQQLPPHDIVVMVRSKILSLTHGQILDRLEQHWRRVVELCEKS